MIIDAETKTIKYFVLICLTLHFTINLDKYSVNYLLW